MLIEIDEKLIRQLLSTVCKEGPSDYFELYENEAELIEYMKSGYSHYLFDEDGSLVFHSHNCFLEPCDSENPFSEHTTMRVKLSDLADDYINEADGSYSTEVMRGHADQLREFAERIDKVCDGLDADELEAMNEPNT